MNDLKAEQAKIDRAIAAYEWRGMPGQSISHAVVEDIGHVSRVLCRGQRDTVLDDRPRAERCGMCLRMIYRRASPTLYRTVFR